MRAAAREPAMTSGAIPPVNECSFSATHRLIPSKYSEEGTVLAALAEDEREIQDLVELDGVTNARLLGEEGLLPGIGVHELLYGVAYSQIVNAPYGGRFNSNRRGAWYAGLELDTSVAEVAFHKLEQLKEVDWKLEEISTCDDYLADFAAGFHDLRGGDLRSTAQRSRRFLKPGPIPECYADSQRLAADLLDRGSNGVVYPSVRRAGGTCIACFRPALVYGVRRAARLELRLRADRSFTPDQAYEIGNGIARRGPKGSR
jgi:RES domain-containing protein